MFIVGLKYAPVKLGIAVYTTGMAEALVAFPRQVRVVAGQTYFPAWKILDEHDAWTGSNRAENCVPVTRVPHYAPTHPTRLKRPVHHASFAMSALVPAVWSGLTFRHDVVLTVALSLIGALVARLAAWVVGARSWLHIQDVEVEAAFATGLTDGERRSAWIARAFEAGVMKSFDLVSAFSPEMCRKLVQKGVPHAKVTEFANWADIDVIRLMAAASPYRERRGISTPHVALYSGNMANKQSLGLVIQAARLLRHREDLVFVICGEGGNRARLQEMAEGLRNVRCHGLQPKENLNELVGLATIHLLPKLAGAADRMLLRKLNNMLASGRPVVATAAPGTVLAREVEGCGVTVEPGDPSAFADAIVRLIDDRQNWNAAATASRRRAEERWGKDVVLGGFVAQLQADDPRHPPLSPFPESD